MSVKPITPSEVWETIPDFVVEVFNKLIAERARNGSAVIRVSEVVALLVETGKVKKEIYDHHWLDVEELYRQAGWEVRYDSDPGCFTFTPPKKRG